jgi:hypothetical protein
MVVLAVLAAATVSAQGPIVLQILDPTPRVQDSNFRLANITGFSVSYVVPEQYRLFGTTNTQRIRWNASLTGFQDMYHTTSLCSQSANPLFWDRRCLDAIGLFSKYIDCAAGAPCQWEGKWNAAPGTLNMSVAPVGWLWPNKSTQPYGSPGFTPIIDKHTVNLVPLNPSSACVLTSGQCPPKSGQEATCSPNNLDSWATGTANAKAVQVFYSGGVYRWFMAFNKQINVTGTASDKWQILWAWSDDGFNWTVDEDILFRSISEASGGFCGLGFLVTDMTIDTGHFYMTFTDVGSNSVYLVRSHIDSYGSDPGYVDTWSVASFPLVNGKWTWKPLTLGQQLNLPAMGAANVFPNPFGGDPVFKVRQSDIGRVFTSATPNSANRIIGLAADVVSGQKVLQVFSTDTLDKPFVYESQVNLAPVTIGANGLEFAFTQYRDNLPSSPRLISSQLDFWIIQNQETPSAPGDWTRRLTASRKTAKITGGIFGP